MLIKTIPTYSPTSARVFPLSFGFSRICFRATALKTILKIKSKTPTSGERSRPRNPAMAATKPIMANGSYSDSGDFATVSPLLFPFKATKISSFTVWATSLIFSTLAGWDWASLPDLRIGDLRF